MREICKAADVNVALVNYYFRNKNGLYQACVERLFHENTGDELCTIDATVSDARAWAEAARLDYEAAARRHEDDNETLSSVLDKLAVSEDAETKLAESAYGEAMSDILLRQAVGIDVIVQNML